MVDCIYNYEKNLTDDIGKSCIRNTLNIIGCHFVYTGQ
jgi:hypothetical protein